MKVLFLNGPNLNLLGQREAKHYGAFTLKELEEELARAFPEVHWQHFQSNHEGELIDEIQRQREKTDGILINPGGLAHSSVSLHDALLDANNPVVEVHISQVHAREDFRQLLITAHAADVVISGMGMEGYRAATRWLLQKREAAS